MNYGLIAEKVGHSFSAEIHKKRYEGLVRMMSTAFRKDAYVWMILNISLIFNCYMMICKQGDEDMPMPERKKLFNNKDEEEK